MTTHNHILLIASLLGSTLAAGAQTLFPIQTVRSEIYNYVPADTVTLGDRVEGIDIFFEEADSVIPDMPDTLWVKPPVTTMSPIYLRPVVFDRAKVFKDTVTYVPTDALEMPYVDPEVTQWLNEEGRRADMMTRTRQWYFVNYPGLVQYDEAHLPEPPREFVATVDPSTATIVFTENIATPAAAPAIETDYGRKHWLRDFNVNLQFSQAYVSPNWYQGGNNNLNALLNIYYNVKLNPAYHPKWIFDNTFQYKLGMNNAPDDKMRDYSISEDLLQWNMTLGYKSAKRWYYSLATQFKTQILKNYKSNTNDLQAAFLSPGELNVGLGMTYSYANPKKTFNFDASISPLSWNLKTCINRDMNVTAFGIKEGRKTVNEIGSSAEGKLQWKICDNISLRSRLFVFTDYDYIYGDLENTIQFTINRFLSTQIYVHARYDSTTKRPDETTDWHKFQLKEILSFGFSYKFATK